MSFALDRFAMKPVRAKYLIVLLTALLLLAPFPAEASADVNSTFLYSLSNFNGKIPFNDVKLHADRFHNEVYVIEKGNVRIFNETGMEIFWFGDSNDLGSVYDIAVTEKGDIFLLSYYYKDGMKYSFIHCNYRGKFIEKIDLKGFPAEYSWYMPSNIFYHNGEIFLLCKSKMRAVLVDKNGNFLKGYDFAGILDIPEKDRNDTEIFGFSIDEKGNMLFTVSVLFKAYIVSRDGKILGSFGKSGAAPGMFGVVSGIVRDDFGNYLVVERLRNVVMIFDENFRFLKEFGYFGKRPENLVGPNDLVLGNSGKLFVTQLMGRGVSVFNITHD